MDTVQEPTKIESHPGGLRLMIGQLSWRIILVRLVINGLTLIVVALLVPNIYFVDRTFLSILVMAVALGLLNAFVKPIVQFLTLPFIFATFGFVVVLINAIILILMALIFEERFYVGGLIWAVVGGLVMGIVSSFLESLLGLNLPIAPRAEESAEGGASSGTGSPSITEVLVDEMTGEKVEQPGQREDGSKTEQPPIPDESALTSADAEGEDPAVSVDERELDGNGAQDKEEHQDSDDVERPGDE